MFKIRNEFDEDSERAEGAERAEKRRREASQNSPDASPGLTPLTPQTTQKPVKKKILNLGQYLEPFSIYNITDRYELRYILHIFKTIECDVYEYNLDKKAYQKNTYRDLCVEFNYSSAQNEVYDMFGVVKDVLIFTLNGQNIRNGISSDSEDIINNLWKKHMYVETDNFGNYKKIVILKYNAPEYYDFEDRYNSMQKSIIHKETRFFDGMITKRNYKETPSEYKYYVDKLGELFQNLPECYEESPMRNNDDMESDYDEFYGGDAKSHRLKKYRAFLKKQSIQKLQNMARNKSIKIERKYKGAMVSIKPDTLMENLYQHFCKMNIK